MDRKEMQRVMQGASVLTAASLIAKVLSALYRIPLQNLVGDESFYIHQQVYLIYGIVMTLALSGLPQSILKYVAERKNPFERKQILQNLYPLVFRIGVFLRLFVFAFSSWIAWMTGDIQSKSLTQVVSLTFLLMSGLSFYRGNFQGRFSVEPTAVSRVVEQFVRVFVIVYSAFAFRKPGWTVYQTGTVAMSGTVFGSLHTHGILHYYEQKTHGGALSFRWFPLFKQPSRPLIRRFPVEGGLVSIYSGLLIFSQLIDSFFVKNALKVYELSEYGAKIAEGVYDRGQPLVQLGLATATTLSVTFLPALTRHLTNQIYRQFLQTAKIYLRLTTALALAASLGLASLLPYISYALFKDYAGSVALVLFVFSIAFTVVIQAYRNIVQGRNSFRPPLKDAGWGLPVKGLTTSFLTGLLGTASVSLSALLGLDVTLWYFIRVETKELNAFWRERHLGRKLTFSLLYTTVILLLCYGTLNIVFSLVTHRSTTLFVSVARVGIRASVFIYAVVRLRPSTVQE